VEEVSESPEPDPVIGRRRDRGRTARYSRRRARAGGRLRMWLLIAVLCVAAAGLAAYVAVKLNAKPPETKQK
jgi:hypothetical protein